MIRCVVSQATGVLCPSRENAAEDVRNGSVWVRAAENSEALPWTDVGGGVAERLLERTERGPFRQTCTLRLEPGAQLPFTAHAGGEDLYVLEGAVELDSVSHPAGDYIGLPPGDQPRIVAPRGCVLFSKSRPTARRRRVVAATRGGSWELSHTVGFWIMRIDEQIDGRAVLLRFEPGTALGAHRHDMGEEFFVLQGSLRDEEGTYGTRWWVRQPPGSTHSVASDNGCLMLTTAGHLRV